MNALLELFQGPASYRIGWTLIHFLWQGAMLAVLFALVRHVLRSASANARYLAGCATMLLMVIVIAITLLQQKAPQPRPIVPAQAQPVSVTSIGPPMHGDTINSVQLQAVPQTPLSSVNLHHLRQVLEQHLHWLVAAWLTGVLALSLRLFGAWLKIHSLKRSGSRFPPEEWHTKLGALKERLRISRPVRLLQSAVVEVPAVIGWLRPIILLPASSITGLSPTQLESILAHELAHIRRHDYLLNLLQSALETLLFYHPAIWWVSKCVRQERENCCDDLAVEVCGDALDYAKALTTLEELRSSPNALAMAADAKPLLHRIRRLLGISPASPKRKWPASSGSIVGLLLLLGLFLALPLAYSQKKESNLTTSTPSTPPLAGTNVLAETTRPEQLWTRSYHFDPNAILPSSERILGTNGLNPDVIPPHIESTITSNLFSLLKQDYHVDIATPPNSYWIKPHRGILSVRTKLSDQEQVEKCMQKLETIAPASAYSAYSPMVYKLDQIVLTEVFLQALPLSEVLKQLRSETKRLDSSGEGVNFIISQPLTYLTRNGFQAGSLRGSSDLAATLITINPPLKSVKLKAVLDAIVKGANGPLEYRVQDTAIIFAPPGEQELIRSSIFNVDPNIFVRGLEKITGSKLPPVIKGATLNRPIVDAFSDVAARECRVKLSEGGRCVLFNETTGQLLVRATPQELQAVDFLVQKLNEAPPQVMVAVKIVEVTDDKAHPFSLQEELPNEKFHLSTNASGFAASSVLLLGQGDGTYSQTDIVTNAGVRGPSLAILNAAQSRKLLKAFEKRSGVDIMAAPKITTLSGRQAQVRIGHTVVVNNETNRPSKTEQVDVGPVCDIVPYALPDLLSLQMTAIGTVKEFLGYDLEKKDPRPLFRQRQVIGPANVWDGQTLVLDVGAVFVEVKTKDKVPILGDVPVLGPLFRSENTAKQLKRLLFLVTPTLIDPAGNPIHTQEDLPFAHDSVPPQTVK